MKKKFYAKLYLTFFAVILLLLLFPVCIFGIKAIYKEKQQQIQWFEENQKQQANTISTIMETHFLELRDLSISLLQEQAITESFRMYQPDISDSVDLFQRIDCIKTVASYLSKSPLISDILVINANKNLLVNHSGWMTIPEYLDLYYPKQAKTLEENFAKKIMFPVDLLFDGEAAGCTDAKSRSSIFLTYSIYGSNNGNRVIFLLDRMAFSSYFEQIHHDFFENQAVYLNEISLLENKTESASWDYDVTFVETNMRYSYQFRPQSLLNSAYLLDFMVAFLFCVVAAWLLATFFFAPFYRIYAKIMGIRSSNENTAAQPPRISINPLKTFEIYFDDMITSQIQLRKKLDHYQEIFRKDDFLLQLLLVKHAEDYLDEMIQVCPWFSEEGIYAVALMEQCSVIPELPKEISQFHCTYHFVKNPNSGLAVIFDLRAKEYTELYQRIQELLPQKLPDIHFYFGSVGTGITGIQNSYHQARQLQRKSDQNWLDSAVFFPISTEIQLLGALKSCHYDQCRQLLEIIFQENHALPLSMQQKKQLYQTIFILLKRYAQDCAFPSEDFQKEFALLLENWEEGALETFLDGFCRQLTLHIQKQNKQKADDLSRQIYEYVRLHFRDPDICVNSVAEIFQVSRNTLSKSFKTVSEVPLPDLVNRLRIAEAIELIRTTNYTLSEISKLTGFESYSTFKRAFIKNMEVSPCDYRQAMMEHADQD